MGIVLTFCHSLFLQKTSWCKNCIFFGSVQRRGRRMSAGARKNDRAAKATIVNGSASPAPSGSATKISFARRLRGEGGKKGLFPAFPRRHPCGGDAPLCLAAVPPFLAAGQERSQAAPSAASGNCHRARQLAGGHTYTKALACSLGRKLNESATFCLVC